MEYAPRICRTLYTYNHRGLMYFKSLPINSCTYYGGYYEEYPEVYTLPNHT